jgi:hypothetical protein
MQKTTVKGAQMELAKYRLVPCFISEYRGKTAIVSDELYFEFEKIKLYTR